MSSVLIVGSGASGAHFALSVVEKGYDVTMIDVGYEPPAAIHPRLPFNALKEELDDPVAYFLGQGYEGVVRPDTEGEYYGFPPSKNYVFEAPGEFNYGAVGFAPLFSFARGGLAEVWTAGCYPFNQDDLASFPFSYAEIEPYYAGVAQRIGITGMDDDLSRFLPFHANLLPPLELDPHSQLLLDTYARKRDALNTKLRLYVGRTRVATLSRDLGARGACQYLGRCLWGCPVDSLYTPSHTLRECLTHPNFTYLPGLKVTHFRVGRDNVITSVVASSVADGQRQEFPVERLVLAAGTLCSSKIVLRSIYEARGEVIRLPGLMDNRQVLVPFVNLRLIGEQFRDETYQYHQLGLGLEMGAPHEYVHGQITTLKTALMHPIIQRVPFDLKSSAMIARSLHAALGVVNVNLHDTRRDDNYLSLTDCGSDRDPSLLIHYAPAAGERAALRRALAGVRKALRKLGCLVPPGMVHVRPMGASVHYAGTMPMSRSAEGWTDENCRSREFPNLYVIDGSTFPFLPAKNITFTLMANAMRVASRAF